MAVNYSSCLVLFVCAGQMCSEMRGAGGFNEWQIKASEKDHGVLSKAESDIQIKTNFGNKK